MTTPSLELLTDPSYASDISSLSIDEIRRRRNACQTAEEAMSLHRRLAQGRLDIVQAELFRRSGGLPAEHGLIESLSEILVERGDRHLGPGRLTSVGISEELGIEFDQLASRLDKIVDGVRLSSLENEDETSVRTMAGELDELERSISTNRHQLHHNIDIFQEEIVRRYKTGEASVEALLES